MRRRATRSTPVREEGWRCPQCGRRFRQRTREHSCDVRPLAAHLDRASADVRATFAALQELLARIGPHSMVPVKTMILLRVRRNFGGVIVRRDALDLEFLSARALQHPRVHKSDPYGARYTHHVRLSSAAEVDADVAAWLREAYVLGAQRDGHARN